MVWQWDTVVSSGLAKVLLFVKGAPVLAKKGHCRISFSELEKKHWPWTPRSGPPQLRWKIDGQTIPNFDPLASCEDLFVWKFGERMYSVLNHLEPTWTSLNLSWNNVCAGEQLGSHFKFVGTDLWTREPIGTYRNQVGIWNQMEPVCAWKSLEMDFRLFLWFVVFLDVVWPMS